MRPTGSSFPFASNSRATSPEANTFRKAGQHMATTQRATFTGDARRQPAGAKQFDPDHLSIHHPPWFSYWLANIGVGSGILANFWQVFTSVVAFFTLFSEGAIYKSLDNHGQVGATFAALAISVLM